MRWAGVEHDVVGDTGDRIYCSVSWLGSTGGLVRCDETAYGADGVVPSAWLLPEEARLIVHEYYDLSDVLQRGMEESGR
jgi:hypothetical protein